MDLLKHIIWLNLFQHLAAGLGIGVIASISISLNLKVQKKFKLNPSSSSSFIQGVTYLLSLGVLIPSVIYIASNVIGGSSLEFVIFIVGVILPFVLAIRTGFIPRESNRNQHEKASE